MKKNISDYDQLPKLSIIAPEIYILVDNLLKNSPKSCHYSSNIENELKLIMDQSSSIEDAIVDKILDMSILQNDLDLLKLSFNIIDNWKDKYSAAFWIKSIFHHKNYGHSIYLSYIVHEKCKINFKEWKNSAIDYAYNKNQSDFLNILKVLNINIFYFKYASNILKSSSFTAYYLRDFNNKNLFPKNYNSLAKEVAILASSQIGTNHLSLNDKTVDLIKKMIFKYSHIPEFAEDIKGAIEQSSPENKFMALKCGITQHILTLSLQNKLPINKNILYSKIKI